MLAVVSGREEDVLKGFRCVPSRLTRELKRLKATVKTARKTKRKRRGR